MLNAAVTASYRCAFMTFKIVDRGLERKFLPGHSFSQADGHCISQRAKARDWRAPLLQLIQLACHFLLCHSVLLWRKVFFPPVDWKFSCQTQGCMQLTKVVSTLLTMVLLHSHFPILLLPAAAAQTRETEKRLLPQGLPWCQLHNLVANIFLTSCGEATEKSN